MTIAIFVLSGFQEGDRFGGTILTGEEIDQSMDAKVTWKGGMSFSGSADSGFELSMGASPVVGGADDGFRPMELILLGLAGCTAMDVIAILQKKRQPVTEFEVRAHAERAEDHPHVFTRSEIEYVVRGHDLSEAAVARAVELSEMKYCPAQAMLRQSMPIELTYRIEAAAPASPD